jgi:hypothetical protein
MGEFYVIHTVHVVTSICHPKCALYDALFMTYIISYMGTAVAQWLRYCATNRKVAGSISDGVIGIFH